MTGGMSNPVPQYATTMAPTISTHSGTSGPQPQQQQPPPPQEHAQQKQQYYQQYHQQYEQHQQQPVRRQPPPAMDVLYNVHDAFSRASQVDRLNFLSMLVHQCRPLEARFLQLALMDPISQSAAALKEAEELANDEARITALVRNRGLLSALHTVADLLPLLRPDNVAAARAITHVLMQCTWHTSPRADQSSRDLCSVCQAAFAMARTHPAIEDTDRTRLNQMSWELLNGEQPQRSRHHSMGTTNSGSGTGGGGGGGEELRKASTSASSSLANGPADQHQSHNEEQEDDEGGVAKEGEETLDDEGEQDGKQKKKKKTKKKRGSTSSTSSRNSQSAAATDAVAPGSDADAMEAEIDHREILSAHIVGIEKDARKKAYCFVLEVQWKGGQATLCRRTHDDFFNFHVALMDKFPEESKKQNRIIPLLPGKRLLSQAFRRRSMRDVAESRREGIQTYVSGLIALPSKISRSAHVLNFFLSCPVCLGLLDECASGCVVPPDQLPAATNLTLTHHHHHHHQQQQQQQQQQAHQQHADTVSAAVGARASLSSSSSAHGSPASRPSTQMMVPVSAQQAAGAALMPPQQQQYAYVQQAPGLGMMDGTPPTSPFMGPAHRQHQQLPHPMTAPPPAQVVFQHPHQHQHQHVQFFHPQQPQQQQQQQHAVLLHPSQYLHYPHHQHFQHQHQFAQQHQHPHAHGVSTLVHTRPAMGAWSPLSVQSSPGVGVRRTHPHPTNASPRSGGGRPRHSSASVQSSQTPSPFARRHTTSSLPEDLNRIPSAGSDGNLTRPESADDDAFVFAASSTATTATTAASRGDGTSRANTGRGTTRVVAKASKGNEEPRKATAQSPPTQQQQQQQKQQQQQARQSSSGAKEEAKTVERATTAASSTAGKTSASADTGTTTTSPERSASSTTPERGQQAHAKQKAPPPRTDTATTDTTTSKGSSSHDREASGKQKPPPHTATPTCSDDELQQQLLRLNLIADDDDKTTSDNRGVRVLVVQRYWWLKQHRLHKYAKHFVSHSRADMHALTLDDFASLGLTKGASNKLHSKLHAPTVDTTSGTDAAATGATTAPSATAVTATNTAEEPTSTTPAVGTAEAAPAKSQGDADAGARASKTTLVSWPDLCDA
ncbi:hypothetical protein PTSG_08297 [Salpingoeca rosetta]|uniref:PX domain-containing protein n=1 Tax=Salpingoeca rosetta (strain ATCC 50818 / BSB-021) TaxID=946362 RepID=F2UJA6_SALR5|nr:uncharacterized protein PTSG_08297 [Salpingoeca rosetta]EGD77205.1 hypothetical protein PTSG_08297 [Salpingoeca rosetta]|eukprot:XP_004990549.1 hypothetical protein PTSG_08297 [Salpingoeca rosetta]